MTYGSSNQIINGPLTLAKFCHLIKILAPSRWTRFASRPLPTFTAGLLVFLNCGVADSKILESQARCANELVNWKVPFSNPTLESSKYLIEQMKSDLIYGKSYLVGEGYQMFARISDQDEDVKRLIERVKRASMMHGYYREYFAEFIRFRNGARFTIEATSDLPNEVLPKDIAKAFLRAGFPIYSRRNPTSYYFDPETFHIEYGPEVAEVIILHSHPPHRIGRQNYILNYFFSEEDNDMHLSHLQDFQKHGARVHFQSYLVPIFPEDPESDLVTVWQKDARFKASR